MDGPSLIEWTPMTQEEFSACFNWGAPEAVPALAVALNEEEPLVRGHAAWTLGRIGTEAARRALRGRGEVEDNAWVREEIPVASYSV